MTRRKLVVLILLAVAPVLLVAQQPGGDQAAGSSGARGLGSSGLDPASILKPLGESWPTYSGDYTGRRYSSLTQINQTSVKNLGLAWVSRGFVQGSGPTGRGAGAGGGGFGGGRGGGGGDVPLTVAGEATGEFNTGGPAQIRGSILMVDGILYPTSPDNLWAVDARDGTIFWQFYWKTRGGTHTGHRGVGMWRNYLFMETHDNYLVKIDARTGKEVWHVEIAPFEQQYFSSMAPIIVGNHVIVGTGNDLDMPGLPAVVRSRNRQAAVDLLHRADESRRSRDSKRGRASRRRGTAAASRGCRASTIRRRASTSSAPAIRRPPTRWRAEAQASGSSRARSSRSTSTPARWRGTTRPRRATCTTGIRRRRRCSSTATINGKPRKLVSTAARNGYFFTVDRVTGEYVASGKFGTSTNWASGLDPQGRPILDPEKVATIPGAICQRQHHQLAAARVFARHRTVLRAREQRAVDRVSHRSGSARLDGARRPADGGGVVNSAASSPPSIRRPAKVAWRHKLSGGGGATGHADDGWTAAVCRRRFGQSRRVRSGQRHAAVALANRQRLERAADLHARRQAVPAGCRRRCAVRVRGLLNRRQSTAFDVLMEKVIFHWHA